MDTQGLEVLLKRTLEGLHIPASSLSLTKLQGDASYRIYYRLVTNSGRSFIVMKLPAGKASASEEITNLKEKPKEPPFITVAHYLKSLQLPVPEILSFDAEEGIMLLQDFGDETFEKRIRPLDEEGRKTWYQKAIDLLVQFQERTAAPSDTIAHQRSFDATLLNWEFEHFLEYGIETRGGNKILSDDRKSLEAQFHRITERITSMPTTLVHRDFQSRNLMVENGELKLLDFQDALRGPLPYDLVALLRDSYVVLPWETVSALLRYYWQHRPSTFTSITQEQLFQFFDLMTIQRKLKDAGRFVYIDRVKGNSSFLQWIPASLGYVREAFSRQPGLQETFALLQKYVPEFRS